MTPEAVAAAARLLLADQAACRVCGGPVVREKRRGRPPTTHPACVRKARTDYERNRVRERAEGRTVEEERDRRHAEAAREAAEGFSDLDAWTTTPGEVRAAFSEEALSVSFLWDEWVTLADDGGSYVGSSSGVSPGLTLGSEDRAAVAPVRHPSHRTPLGDGERRAVVGGVPLVLREPGRNH